MSKRRNKVVSLPVIEPDAAGIDVGATEMFVAMPADRDPEPIRCFPYLHRRSGKTGGLASAVPDSDRSHAVDRSVLTT
jgi:hypothetical protein